MATSHAKSHGFVKDSLEQAQARLEAFEKEAGKVLEELRTRSKSSRKEIASVLSKFQAGELFTTAKSTERKVERQLRVQAKQISGELAERLTAIQDAVLRFVGVASRDQVEDLVSELEKISKRLERLAKSANGATKKKPAKNGAASV